MKSQPYTTGGQLVTEIVLEIFSLNGRLISAGDRLTAPLGLTSARWQVLGALHEGAAPASHVARRMGLTRQSVQRVVNILLDEGLVLAEENPHHKRAHLLRLSDKGEKTLAKITDRWAKVANEMADGFTEKQLRQVDSMLKTLTDNLPDIEEI